MRRDVLLGAPPVTVTSSLPSAAAPAKETHPFHNPDSGAATMSTVATRDGTEIYYKPSISLRSSTIFFFRNFGTQSPSRPT
jgi:hypothetical protein